MKKITIKQSLTPLYHSKDKCLLFMMSINLEEEEQQIYKKMRLKTKGSMALMFQKKRK
jgi:hypothetical protein